MKKVLITGCAGLIGSHFSKYLLANNYSVIGIDDFSGGYEEFLPQNKNFTFHKRCLGKDDISDIFMHQITESGNDIDCVFHFAAYAAEGLSPFIRHYNYQNNVLASIDVVNECIKHNIKIVFTSSMAVYGAGKPPFTEDMPTNPIDPYGIAKNTVECDIKQAADQFNLKYNIVRPHNVLGTYQNIWDKYRNVIGIFIRRTLDGLPMLVYGDGKQIRAFSNIKYYMEPFEKLITSHNNETFNIGADKCFEIGAVANLVKEIAKKYDISAEIKYVEPRHEVKYAYCDHTKAKELLSFKDETILEELVVEMLEWAMKQDPKEVKHMNYEVEKNIYSYWVD
jgi:UDP-glucose 4-epimerase